MKRILVTYATQGEFVSVNWCGFDAGYLRTGIGKVKSAFYLSEAVEKMHPDVVLNVGTSGTVEHSIGDIFVCRDFIDRDMFKLKEYGVSYKINQSVDRLDFLPDHIFSHFGICNTGDTFLTEHESVVGDVIDMEAYAQAFVCSSKNIPFLAVKYVTDVIGQNSVEIWQDKIADAVCGLRTFLNKEKK